MRVLVTYGWCRTAYVICESLARAGFAVSACGDSALCMTRASRYVDTFDRVPDPFAHPERYAMAVGEIVRRRGVRIVVPAHEDFMVLQEFRYLLPADLILAAPSYDQGLLALDKWSLLQRAREAGVPVPETLAPCSIEEAERMIGEVALPAILKPRRGNGGKGVSIILDARRGRAEYVRLVEEFGISQTALPLIQQCISGVQMGSCFLAVDGVLQACFVERYQRCKQSGFGTSVLREPARNAAIRDYTAALVADLKWTGVGHLDFIVDEGSAKPYLLEMNPRFWGALNLSARNGFDFPVALVSLAATGAVDPKAFAVRPPAQSLWIAGEFMACVDDLRNGRWRAALKTPARILSSRYYDDFRLKDPFPLFVELLYYLTGFVRTNGDINPVSVGMIQPSTRNVL